MPSQKRKRIPDSEDEPHTKAHKSNTDEDEFDIASALVGNSLHDDQAMASDDEALNAFIQDSISRRDKKTGTGVVKNAKGKAKLAKGEVGGGSFQSMGLHPSLLRSLTLQGFRIPTPIQRLAIPALLANPPKDLVGMARTGSGKSLAFMVPLIQRLGGRHSTTFGARALILLPTRELALQLLKVGKELARGWQVGGEHAGDRKGKGREDPAGINDEAARKGQNLRWGLVVGGEGMDEQFEMMTNNPDVIIATPGRLLHLIVEMNLDLKGVQYVVFDEADRLFEMGFETALNEILQRLPTSRQTLLFSATLPKSLVEFAKAGLQNPKLVRLDAESKISSDLKMAFFSVRQAEKEACLLTLLREVIKVPLGVQERSAESSKKGKKMRPEPDTAPHQTLIFAATKHHVEYLTTLLATAGFSVSHIYGSLDQAARTFQMDQFRKSATSILVVTDVAARGIDIPVLENVINYDFPQGARVFVHRVGRTARAGRQGWAWSFVTNTELPHLLDLQLFLGRPLRSSVDNNGSDDRAFIDTLVLGTFERGKVDEDVEYIRSLDGVNHSLPTLREVMRRGHTMYERSKGKASPASYKRAKEMTKDVAGQWQLAGVNPGVHPVLLRGIAGAAELEAKRQSLLKSVDGFRPAETVFEISAKGKAVSATVALMKDRRKALEKSRSRTSASGIQSSAANAGSSHQEIDSNEDISAILETSSKGHSYRDEEFYMSYHQKDATSEKGYSLTDGASFVEQARGATFDLAGDEATTERKRRQLNWDKKKKKFIKGDGAGSDNVKLVKTENGTRLPATYRSGRFDEWRAKARVSLPRVGEMENQHMSGRKPIGGHRFKHNKVIEAKPLDKLRKDYERRMRQGKKSEEGSVSGVRGTEQTVQKGPKLGGRNAGKSVGRVKSELRTVDQIRKNRKLVEKRRAKNSRPSKKGRR